MVWRILLIVVVVSAAFFWGFSVSRTESVETISTRWAASGHADETSISFTNWDATEPPQVPVVCAKCHSSPGFLDYLGEDGSEFGVVNQPAPLGTTIYCHTCHNDTAHALTSVVFPSQIELTGFGPEATCMQCHQGRTSTGHVDRAITGLGDDEVSGDLAFINVHYRVAAATQMGGEAQIGYQYEGREYVGRFLHMPDVRACTDCHDPHSTRINPSMCAPCHVNVVGVGDLRQIRTSPVDYDGDGNAAEGIDGEIFGLRQALYETIQRYAQEVVGTPIGHAHRFPYWFVDTDGDGEISPDEAVQPNRYQAFTPRLLKATYNYQFSLQDPGNYTHNARYVLQLLYDSIADLGEQVESPIDTLRRP